MNLVRLRILPAIGLFLLLDVACPSTSSAQEITVYPVNCRGAWVDRNCIGSGKTPLDRITFRVFPQTQTVITWKPDLQLPPEKLTGCVVGDSENWHCNEAAMAKGVLVRADDEHRSSIRDITALQWWSLKLGETVFAKVFVIFVLAILVVVFPFVVISLIIKRILEAKGPLKSRFKNVVP